MTVFRGEHHFLIHYFCKWKIICISVISIFHDKVQIYQDMYKGQDKKRQILQGLPFFDFWGLNEIFTH